MLARARLMAAFKRSRRRIAKTEKMVRPQRRKI
jgi:hypothetical protein